MKIGIAGAGLLGRLLAFKLAHAGHSVTVFDRAASPEQRGAAGWTAAGMLSPMAELETANLAVFEQGVRSLDLWQSIVTELRKVAPEHPVMFKQLGSLLIAHKGDEGAAKRMLDLLAHKTPPKYAPHAPQALSREALQTTEPAVHTASRAWLLPLEGQIDTVQAMTALTAAATKLGATWRWGETVTQLEQGMIETTPLERIDPSEPSDSSEPIEPIEPIEPSDSSDPSEPSDPIEPIEPIEPFGLSLSKPIAYKALRQAQGERSVYTFDSVFDVRGTGARPDWQVRGVRGEILWLHAPSAALQRPIRLLHPRHRVYLVPREGNRIVVGASEIESEDRSPISLRSTVELLAAAHSVIPELAEARIIHSETNLRPALPDNLPRMESTGGLTRINGLFRHGWLIAPALVEQALENL
ncbi:MAG: FAD-dependent oxidoreductase [Cytophagales bacterium]|nr:FAD-dependent oxidoreductase [Cytophagales bacterium]